MWIEEGKIDMYCNVDASNPKLFNLKDLLLIYRSKQEDIYDPTWGMLRYKKFSAPDDIVDSGILFVKQMSRGSTTTPSQCSAILPGTKI